jgi:hypothetical protein
MSEIGNKLKYEFDEEYNFITISWNYYNEEINNIMESEYRLTDLERKNLMWIEKIKEYAKWNGNEELYIFTKTNADGCFYAWFYRDRSKCPFVDILLEKNGYVSMAYHNNAYGYDFDEDNNDTKSVVYIRPCCHFNDINYERRRELKMRK